MLAQLPTRFRTAKTRSLLQNGHSDPVPIKQFINQRTFFLTGGTANDSVREWEKGWAAQTIHFHALSEKPVEIDPHVECDRAAS
jgi:hypothetical protein